MNTTIHKCQLRKKKIWGILASLLLGFAPHALAQTAMIPLPPTDRTPLVTRPLVFVRTQSQYNLYFNYLHYYTPEWRWIDRPLFFDRSLAPKVYSGSTLTNPSFSRIIDSALPYEIDGFSHLTVAGSSQVKNYLKALELSSLRPKPFPILMELAPGGKDAAQVVTDTSKLIDAALASPAAPRINGKVLITSYNLDTDSLQIWKQVIDQLHQKYGDKFIVVASIVLPWWPPYADAKDGSIDPQQFAQLKEYLRSWLDVFDGILYSAAGHATDPTNDDLLDQGFYEYIARTCDEVLSEPAYRQKYFGLSAAVGYFNPITASRSNENGTEHLRDSLRIALDAHPDFLILPEWDEVNENTSFEPTVYNSFSTQRILRYKMRQLKKEPLAPQTGDDLSIPNLTISYRAFLQLGEPLQVEVLNVPDGSATGNYTLQLSLKDINHNTIKVLSRATLSATELRDQTFTIPTEELAQYPVLMPSLQVTSPDGKTQTFEDGLMCIRLRPTQNWNYKWVKMPLRDLLKPASVTFTQNGSAHNSSISVRGNVETKEQIASVEVVADGRELYAVDPAKTWELKPDEALLMMHELSPDRINNFDGKYFVTGGNIRKVNYQFAFWAARKPDQIASVLTRSPLGEIFIVDHKDTSVLHVENSIYKTAIPISKILKDGIYSEVHGKGVTLTVRDFHGLPEMPLPLNATKSTFETTVQPVRPETALQMRVITKSGKIYRSWPILVAPQSEGKVLLPVYSQTTKKAVNVQVDKSRIPQIDVTPAQMNGAEIQSSFDPYFDGLAGGVPFWTYIASGPSAYPAGATQTAPVRVTEDGNDCWKFDGKGNYLYFPPETLPRGAFTLSFTIKPTSAKRQLLFVNRGHSRGAFSLMLDNGRLSATYTDQLRRKEPYFREFDLNPEISLPLNQWSTVEITYDLKQMIFNVNGKAGKSIPLAAKGISYAPLLFGGWGNGKGDGYFEGYLKEIKIRHGA